MKKTIIALALCVCVAGVALADDFNPPAWYDDGNPTNTRQAWEFSTDCGSVFPAEVVDNPFGTPCASIGGLGADWIPAFMGGPYGLRTGVLQAVAPGDFIEFTIPNEEDLTKYKEIVVLLTVATNNPNFVLDVDTTVTAPNASAVRTNLIQTGAADGWIYIEDHWTITPQPGTETYRLELKSSWPFDIEDPTGLWLDEAVIYTRCVPEPATMSLVAVGGLALLRRRR